MAFRVIKWPGEVQLPLLHASHLHHVTEVHPFSHLVIRFRDQAARSLIVHQESDIADSYFASSTVGSCWEYDIVYWAWNNHQDARSERQNWIVRECYLMNASRLPRCSSWLSTYSRVWYSDVTRPACEHSTLQSTVTLHISFALLIPVALLFLACSRTDHIRLKIVLHTPWLDVNEICFFCSNLGEINSSQVTLYLYCKLAVATLTQVSRSCFKLPILIRFTTPTSKV